MPSIIVVNVVNETSNFVVGLTNDHPLATNPEPGDYAVCGQYPGTVSAGATVSLQCSDPDLTPARYVIVQIPTTDYVSLALCEVEVYTTEGYISIYLFV